MGNDVVLSLSFFKLTFSLSLFISLARPNSIGGRVALLWAAYGTFCFRIKCFQWRKNDGFDKIAELNIATYFSCIERMVRLDFAISLDFRQQFLLSFFAGIATNEND